MEAAQRAADDGDERAVRRWVEELLGMVGLVARVADRYPHELSGGMRQCAGSPWRWPASRS